MLGKILGGGKRGAGQRTGRSEFCILCFVPIANALLDALTGSLALSPGKRQIALKSLLQKTYLQRHKDRRNTGTRMHSNVSIRALQIRSDWEPAQLTRLLSVWELYVTITSDRQKGEGEGGGRERETLVTQNSSHSAFLSHQLELEA